LLYDLLELFFTELVKEFFIKDGHDTTLLLLGYQLLKQSSLIFLRHVRDGIKLGLFRSVALPGRLFAHSLHPLIRLLGRRLLIVPMRAVCSIRLRCNELLVALCGLAWFGCLWSLCCFKLFASRWANHGRLVTVLGRSLHEALQWVGLLVHHAFSSVAHCRSLTA